MSDSDARNERRKEIAQSLRKEVFRSIAVTRCKSEDINLLAESILNSLENAWADGRWVATVCMCDRLCEELVREFIVTDFQRVPPEHYDDVLTVLGGTAHRLLASETIQRLKRLNALRLYYDQPDAASDATWNARSKYEGTRFIEDFPQHDAEEAMALVEGLQTELSCLRCCLEEERESGDNLPVA